MDRSTWYYKQNVTHTELDQASSDYENADRNFLKDEITLTTHDSWGVYSGLVVAEQGVPDLTVQISDGAAYDEEGRRIPVTGGPGTVDLTAQVPATPGESRYVRIFVGYLEVGSDPRIDGLAVPLNYRLSESFEFLTNPGAAGVGPSKPGFLSDKVCVATVLLTNGMASILDANISMLTTNSRTAPDRHSGGHLPRGRVLSPEHAVVFDAPAVTAADLLVLAGNNIRTAAIVEANEPDVANDQGFVYVDPTTGTEIDVDKRWSCDASKMLPGEQNGEIHDRTPVLNSWYLDEDPIGTMTISGDLHWRQNFTSPDGDNRTALFVPISIPDGAKLVSATVSYTVDSGGLHAYHYLRLYLLRRNSGSGATVVDELNDSLPPANERNAAAGNYSWTEDYDTVVDEIVNNNTHAYMLAIVNHSAGGSTVTEDEVKIRSAEVRYQIREASGTY